MERFRTVRAISFSMPEGSSAALKPLESGEPRRSRRERRAPGSPPEASSVVASPTPQLASRLFIKPPDPLRVRNIPGSGDARNGRNILRKIVLSPSIASRGIMSPARGTGENYERRDKGSEKRQKRPAERWQRRKGTDAPEIPEHRGGRWCRRICAAPRARAGFHTAQRS